MKNIIISALVIVAALTFFAFQNHNTKSVGAIGNVKYSVLKPGKFNEENGNGWDLMDDKIPLQGTIINSKHGIAALPDVRGLFIRCLNGTRNDDKEDEFKKENNRDRLLLEYRPDAVKENTHNLSHKFGYFCGWTSNSSWTTVQSGNLMAANKPECTIKIQFMGGNLNSDETKPKNIALNTYIKINK